MSDGPTSILLRAARLWDGTGRGVVESGAVAVVDGRITAVGAARDVAVPDGAEIVELPGHTLMPGLIDAHTHLSQAGERRIYDVTPVLPETRVLEAVRNLRRDLRVGITTLRVVGTPDFIDIPIREAIAAGVIPGPRIWTATRALHATNGHGYAGGFDGPDELRKAVRLNLRNGADLIKFMATGSVDRPGGHFAAEYTAEEIAVIVEEAHRVGRRVATHCIRPPEIRTCVELGVDCIEHAHMLDETCLAPMRERGTWIVGTLAIVLDPDVFAADLEANPTFRDIEWLPRRAQAAESTRMALAAGIRYACGTDSLHGDMAYEIRAHVEIGIPAERAMLAATRDAAAAAGLDGQIGTLETGKAADIIAVDGDPLALVQSLERVRLVMKAGRQYDLSEL